MNDPYSVLGVDPRASDDEIKRAYRELARKYHPDNYQNNPLADLAEEKMKAINEAYDAIQKQRQGGGSFTASASGGYGSQNTSYGTNDYSTNPAFSRVRSAISAGDLTLADQMLHQLADGSAEWHFLSGVVAQRRGWLDEAMQHFRIACQMQPGNAEYRQALSMMQHGSQPGGHFGGGGMDLCSTLICLDCMCPCCGFF